MMFRLLAQRDELCVLAVSTDVLDLPGVVVTDGNASGDYVRFAQAPTGLQIVNRELTFAEYWTDNNLIQYYRLEDARRAYQEQLKGWEPVIDKITDLFMRMRTKQAELAATVHFVTCELREKSAGAPTETQILREVLKWKHKRRPPL